MKKRIIFIMFLCFISLITIIIVSADEQVEQKPYQIEFENGKKIFYMYPCYTYNENGISDDNWLKSGLYYNTDPLENIYLINLEYNSNRYYFYERELVFSDDGIYFANIPWAQSDYPSTTDGTAIEFYENGLGIKKYIVADLVKNKLKLKYTVSHIYWEQNEKREFDAVNNILSVTTNDNITYKFDLTTGNIIDKIPNENFKFTIIILSTIILCIFILILFIAKKHSNCHIL
ncbi:MAG: hypothetical protein FWF15_10440 [Oscillospiraceae bacterium]|nr:hypothetical protein [Oscillospiraceae bacterium]